MEIARFLGEQKIAAKKGGSAISKKGGLPIKGGSTKKGGGYYPFWNCEPYVQSNILKTVEDHPGYITTR